MSSPDTSPGQKPENGQQTPVAGEGPQRSTNKAMTEGIPYYIEERPLRQANEINFDFPPGFFNTPKPSDR